ncbi:putative zinc metalloprotease [Rhizodiscina lignyota]|uniref:Zinc metalloprotease n=1 Tax=Rhizodiscina lignyota TaxID=1504668 RepID=A0A9P4IFT1_9PEZI|nr:putative zinc metalloprotease [Rhizodiscina lignyota]
MPAMKQRQTHFKKIQQFKPDYAIAEFTQYESERTGLRVAVCDRKGPKVNGYFALATEIHDDSGAPHTLEHLCFMGSKSYRYKGVLDRLATRAYSNTNAWTATDHTAYTLDTAGWEGFAQILPVYLEHVLLPTLTDSGCYTEVWHIDGEGNDAGVVYSEMQGVENNQSELMELQARRHIYPEGDGFRYETGGLTKNLRVLTADRIREFHREMYQPKNLRVVLVGEVDHDNLLEILDDFEDTILSDVPPLKAPFTRPWIESKRSPFMEKTVVDTVEFPEEDESSGEVLIGLFGPDFTDNTAGAAMDVLLTYLAGSSVSLLENVLVEKEQVCSAVWHYNESRPNALIWFTLSSVATEKLANVEKRFFEIITDAASQPIDMAYMKDCLRRFRRQVVYAAETSNTIWYEPIINDHLFGDREGKDLEDGCSSLKHMDELEEWTDGQWRKFLKHWFIDNHHVSILGVPSAKLSKKLKDDEKARVKAQQERLGEEGLKKLAKKLDDAKAENERDIPPEILDRFDVPGTESIHFIPTTTARSGLAKKMGKLDNEMQHIIDRDDADSRLFIHFEHMPTNFSPFTLVMSTSAVPVELKPLISLYMLNFFTTPIMRNGKRLEFEEVVTTLEQDTITYDISTGSGLRNSELLRITLVAEPEKYPTMISWLRDLLFNNIFDPERLQASLTKMLADIPDEKRSGNDMVNAVSSMLHLNSSSASRSHNTLVKALYLKRINKLLQSDPQAVIDRMTTVRDALCTFENFRVLVVANLEKLPAPVSSWDVLTRGLDTTKPLRPLDSRKDSLSEAAKNPGSLAYIIPMPTIDSSFAVFTAKGPSGYQHPSLPALMVALAYLDAVEGPMWVAVRGTGLAYGTNFSHGKDTGLIGFSVYRSPDAYKAFVAARKVVTDFVSGEREFDKHGLEGAISSIILGMADEQPTMMNAATLGFVNMVVKEIPKEWGKEMLKKVREVSVQDIKTVMEEIVMGVFIPGKADVMVTCATLMEEKLKKDLEEVGFKPEVQPLTYFQDDYGLKIEGDENGGDDEDDDEFDEDDEEDEEDDAEDGAEDDGEDE